MINIIIILFVIIGLAITYGVTVSNVTYPKEKDKLTEDEKGLYLFSRIIGLFLGISIATFEIFYSKLSYGVKDNYYLIVFNLFKLITAIILLIFAFDNQTSIATEKGKFIEKLQILVPFLSAVAVSSLATFLSTFIYTKEEVNDFISVFKNKGSMESSDDPISE